MRGSMGMSVDNHYQASFETLPTRRREPSWVTNARHAAMKRFSHRGFPTIAQEAFRHTDLSPIADISFSPGFLAEFPHKRNNLWRSQLPDFWSACPHLVLGNETSPLLSNFQGSSSGLRLALLSDVLEKEAEKVEAYFLQQPSFCNSLSCLNEAFTHDGAFLEIPRGHNENQPVFLIYAFDSLKDRLAFHPRTLIVAKENSRCTIVEIYLGSFPSVHWVNPVTQLFLEDSSTVEHIRIQCDSSEAFHTGHVWSFQGESSSLTSTSVSLGGSIVRNDIHALMKKEGGRCALYGLYVAGNREIVDHHTIVEHQKPACVSRELYKGILDGQAHGVFEGKVVVALQAQQTDSQQVNRNVLLSNTSWVDSSPALSILADDVLCTHASTIGPLSGDELFYLQSRGIPESASKQILIQAYANEVLNQVEEKELQTFLKQKIGGHLFHESV